MNILNNMIDGLEKAHEHLLKGLDVFKLNDTFGFPLDLTKEIAAEQGIEIDEEGFHAEMTKQKERARAERLKKNISGWSKDLFGALDAEPTVFTGYETLNDTGVVVALSDEETLTDAIATDEEAKDGVVVLDKTPFYAEMGGQAADHGMLNSADCSLRVLDVKKTPKGYYVHTCVLESGIVKVGDHLTARWIRNTAWPLPATTPPPICCRQLCVKCWATTSIRQAPIRCRDHSLRLYPLQRCHSRGAGPRARS